MTVVNTEVWKKRGISSSRKLTTSNSATTTTNLTMGFKGFLCECCGMILPSNSKSASSQAGHIFHMEQCFYQKFLMDNIRNSPMKTYSWWLLRWGEEQIETFFRLNSFLVTMVKWSECNTAPCCFDSLDNLTDQYPLSSKQDIQGHTWSPSLGVQSHSLPDPTLKLTEVDSPLVSLFVHPWCFTRVWQHKTQSLKEFFTACWMHMRLSCVSLDLYKPWNSDSLLFTK